MGIENQPPWVLTVDETVAQYQTSLQTGLSPDEVQKRAAEYGHNELEKEPATPLWKLVLEQFNDMLVKVLHKQSLDDRNKMGQQQASSQPSTQWLSSALCVDVA
jgi:hypothetical protein